MYWYNIVTIYVWHHYNSIGYYNTAGHLCITTLQLSNYSTATIDYNNTTIYELIQHYNHQCIDTALQSTVYNNTSIYLVKHYNSLYYSTATIDYSNNTIYVLQHYNYL